MTNPVVPCTVCGLGTTATDAICASCRPLLTANRRGKQRIVNANTKLRPRPQAPRRR